MRTSNKYLTYILLATLSLLTYSCSKDDDTTTSGSTDDRTKFVGTWACEEDIIGGPTTIFSISITTHGDEDSVYIYNFNNLGDPLFAVGLVADNSLVIPNQSITQVDILGSGVYSSNKIFMNYTADSDSLSAVCTK